MFKACYDVRESSAFWHKVALHSQLTEDSDGSSAEMPQWLSTHPNHESRAKKLDAMIPSVSLVEHSATFSLCRSTAVRGQLRDARLTVYYAVIRCDEMKCWWCGLPTLAQVMQNKKKWKEETKTNIILLCHCLGYNSPLIWLTLLVSEVKQQLAVAGLCNVLRLWMHVNCHIFFDNLFACRNLFQAFFQLWVLQAPPCCKVQLYE